LPTSLTEATRLELACFQFVRKSTRTFGSFVSTFTLHRIPRHSIEIMEALTASIPCSTTISGTTHSCKLTPPCAYFSPARKLAIPGGEAILTCGLHCHEYDGTEGSPFTTAQRDHLVAARYGGRSTFGKPPGIRSQPWSVTTDTLFPPDSKS